jgi:hypothetical protein
MRPKPTRAIPISPDVAGSGTALVDEYVAETESATNPPGELTAARIPVMVPGIRFWLVKATAVGLLPEALVPKYAIPFPFKEMDTLLTAT